MGKRNSKHQPNVSNNNSSTKKRYSRTPKTLVFVALFHYEAHGTSDISFNKGDFMEIALDAQERDWVSALHLKTRKRGLVPSSFVAVRGSIEAEDWFFGSISRKEAEELVLNPNNSSGTFVVRPSEKIVNAFSLTVKDVHPYHGPYARNFRIKSDERGYYIFPNEKFKTVQGLIGTYQKRHNPYKLGQPCPKPAPQLWDLTPEMQDKYEIDRSEIKLISKIGGGQFGEVYHGKWQKTIDVAIKTLKPGTMTAEAFLEEAKIMKEFRHNKLVALYAVCTREEPMYIITEYMRNGSLLDFLRKPEARNEIKVGHLVYIVSQIATGMAFLESKNLVHRDLAARNILIGENYCAKVADFGLARVLTGDPNDKSHQPKMLPIKWTAPEAFIYSRFSTKSDVWSFGVVLMETFTYGEKPYAGMTGADVAKALKRGYRMPKPKDVPDVVYDQMMNCWKERAEARPTFEYLADFFENFDISTEDTYE